MSEWNYTECSKPFASHAEAREFMLARGFAGQVLKRESGGFTAVCPTYPEGFYLDAVNVETINEESFTASSQDKHLTGNECCVE